MTLLTSKYDSEMAAIYDLQDELAEALARALGLQSSSSEAKPPEPPTKNPRAYELFLRAVERLSCVNRWDTRTAIEMLENATQLAPDFNQAWARLAEACVFMAGTFDPRPIWYKKAEQALRRALAGNPSDSHALCARGRVLWTPLKGYKNREALGALAESLRRSPGYHSALVWKSLILLHCGVHEETVEGLHAALAAHPDDGFALTFLGQVMLFESKYDEAERYFNRALSLDPSSLWANLFSPMVPLYGPNPESAVGVLNTAQQIVESPFCTRIICGIQLLPRMPQSEKALKPFVCSRVQVARACRIILCSATTHTSSRSLAMRHFCGCLVI